MRSTELYRVAERQWHQQFLDWGFTRARGRRANWFLPASEGRQVLVGIYVSQHGWDRFRGSDFVVELELSHSFEAGGPYEHRERLGERFTTDQLETVRLVTNDIVSRLPRPLASELGMEDDDPDFHAYLNANFQPVSEVYPADLHFRYLTEQDAHTWLELLLPTLPPALEAFRRRQEG